ncbi:SipW-dependent-type signal peptide-containing protein [Dietzia sp. ANT_WB102]|uniref:SipW-dependent-type signal peptide-containing protein n=1 Tax=Dietzia sp. ANT_WB102 TaxID=2597345 RepID=UPI0011ED860B|nr:SipW-dependent-type signal peptide-containing protein [Dietzia sp. ANT_WB102]KAA0918765.1 hypothetical protein FQ137_05430 [Dietzia sp. ANT_WB102]
MTANDPIVTDVQRQQDRKRKRKAILAGGVVLGLGAAITLAAWSDDVFANGIFNTGSFELQGNLTTTAVESAEDVPQYENYDDTPGGTLRFDQVLTAVTLQPGEEVFAPITLRLSPETTVDGTFVLSGVTFGTTADPDLADKLDYRVITNSTAAQCDAQTPAGSDWYTGTVADDAPGVSNSGASARPLTAAAATQDQLCLGITLNDNSEDVQGATDTQVIWQFTATANTP